MSIRSTIDKLPADIITEIKRRSRSGHSDILTMTAWLNGLGYKISKSSLGRYAKKLRDNDESHGYFRAVMPEQRANIAALFEELAQIKTREAEILAHIRMATLS